jgi:hypothetical protein
MNRDYLRPLMSPWFWRCLMIGSLIALPIILIAPYTVPKPVQSVQSPPSIPNTIIYYSGNLTDLWANFSFVQLNAPFNITVYCFDGRVRLSTNLTVNPNIPNCDCIQIDYSNATPPVGTAWTNLAVENLPFVMGCPAMPPYDRYIVYCSDGIVDFELRNWFTD